MGEFFKKYIKKEHFIVQPLKNFFLKNIKNAKKNFFFVFR